MPFDATGRTAWAVPFGFEEYVALVEWTGRLVHPAKRGSIPDQQPPILARIGVDGEAFIAMSATFLKEFGSAVGSPARLTDLCERRQTRFLHGMRAARRVFGQLLIEKDADAKAAAQAHSHDSCYATKYEFALVRRA